MGRVLYEKGGLQFDHLSEEAQLEAEEDYQMCVRRCGERVRGNPNPQPRLDGI